MFSLYTKRTVLVQGKTQVSTTAVNIIIVYTIIVRKALFIKRNKHMTINTKIILKRQMFVESKIRATFSVFRHQFIIYNSI